MKIQIGLDYKIIRNMTAENFLSGIILSFADINPLFEGKWFETDEKDYINSNEHL